MTIIDNECEWGEMGSGRNTTWGIKDQMSERWMSHIVIEVQECSLGPTIPVRPDWVKMTSEQVEQWLSVKLMSQVCRSRPITCPMLSLQFGEVKVHKRYREMRTNDLVCIHNWSPLVCLFGPDYKRNFFSYSHRTYCKCTIFCKNIDAQGQSVLPLDWNDEGGTQCRNTEMEENVPFRRAAFLLCIFALFVGAAK